ncbi:SDR family NAD(P)-dependent oxidoreductase [Streptomyces ureilyticus]|uniref:SDR family NAD(P)-dependent oxidoreductase n=1 Tax=Streptomyces ureilyticus TaxID=1775131 RepID=A0ABX0DMI0_9ACTN|nr:SDR family NAD(P)-dependent oxidoreductase [Streptomyces ureilyticus]NGO43092.1 SDR family NAD(P)-dependent oxidoreductase [Streptomyces ureilyticus]
MSKKVVWIVGASSGIGEGLAKEYSRRGALVVLSARRVPELERVRSELASPDAALCVPYDVTDFAGAEEVVSGVLAEVGHVDVLINNAGIDYKDWVRNTPLSIYQRVTDINYYGNISLTLALLPSLRPGAQVAVVSSINGLLSDKCSSAYAAAKHALLGFYDALRAEQPELIISVIVPGFVATSITVNSINGGGQTYGERSEASLTGMSVDRFSTRAVDALERHRPLIVIAGPTERLAVRLHRWFPSLFYRIVARAHPEYENNNR